VSEVKKMEGVKSLHSSKIADNSKEIEGLKVEAAKQKEENAKLKAEILRLTAQVDHGKKDAQSLQEEQKSLQKHAVTSLHLAFEYQRALEVVLPEAEQKQHFEKLLQELEKEKGNTR
ncbi:unnamed protein product, partial [Effrenium voratum]